MQTSEQKLFDQLGALLRRRISIIADHALRDVDPAAQLEQLRAVSEEIGGLHERHKGELPPRLNHFLQQASFTKALECIEGRGA